MSVPRTIFKVAFYGVLMYIAACHGMHWRRNNHAINMATSKPTENMLAQRFSCTKRLVSPITYFSLNVTLNSSAFLEDPKEAVLKQSSPNNTWHYLKSPIDFYKDGDLTEEFTLIYNKTLVGNCSFNFEKNEHEEAHTGMTYMPTDITSSSDFESTTEHNTESISNNSSEILNTTKTPISTCLCPCECFGSVSKIMEDAVLTEMLNDLRIHKAMTSFSKRKLSSATDMRLSSKSIGLLGAFFLTVVFGVIFIGDAKLFLHNARTTLGYLRERYRT